MRLAGAVLLLVAACRSPEAATPVGPHVRVPPPTRLKLGKRDLSRGVPILNVLDTEAGPVVLIPAGAADGVYVGDAWYLRHGVRYRGSLRIRHVEQFDAVGLIEPETENEGVPLAGDLAYPGPADSEVVQMLHRLRWIEFAWPGIEKEHDPGRKTLAERKIWLRARIDKLAELEGRARGGSRSSAGSSGRVMTVRSSDFGTRVAITVGSAEGVREGDVYHIRRGASYVGQMRIDRVEKDRAVGLFDTEFMGPGAPPFAGDVAYPEG